MSNNILAKGGDFLPRYHVEDFSGERKRTYETTRTYKDGETPGQEWSPKELKGIRMLADPRFSSHKKIAQKLKIQPKTIRRWMDNPYFMNAVHQLATYSLMRSRTLVIRSVIRAAIHGTKQDRELYFRLIGELEETKVVKTKNIHAFETLSDKELEEQIGSDLDLLSDADTTKLIDDTKEDPE
jgi:hypothetical protein